MEWNKDAVWNGISSWAQLYRSSSRESFANKNSLTLTVFQDCAAGWEMVWPMGFSRFLFGTSLPWVNTYEVIGLLDIHRNWRLDHWFGVEHPHFPIILASSCPMESASATNWRTGPTSWSSMDSNGGKQWIVQAIPTYPVRSQVWLVKERHEWFIRFSCHFLACFSDAAQVSWTKLWTLQEKHVLHVSAY
jgi:hypothetical protein